jgi:hypothetical protein
MHQVETTNEMSFSAQALSGSSQPEIARRSAQNGGESPARNDG